MRGQNKQGFLDINASMLFNNKFLFGITLTSRQTLIFLTEFNISSQFKIGYAYDYTATQLSNGGSHEIFIGYDFLKHKSQVVSPRYF